VVQRAYSEQQTKPTNVTSRYDGTVLTAAAHPGHVEVVRILADAGAPLDHVVWDGSSWGKVRCMCRFSEAVEPGTVWTWNAIGKAAGAWSLAPDANESRKGFLLNHLISEGLPAGDDGQFVSNADPVTGQAGWYDVRVRVYRAEPGEPEESYPQVGALTPVPGQTPARTPWLAYMAGRLARGSR